MAYSAADTPPRITYVGHAGFCLEDDRTVVVMDPWFSRTGAFDAAWFQFPPNGHSEGFVRERLADQSRERYLYISHEHGDHFDFDFLQSLEDRGFTIVAPHFSREAMVEKLAGYRCRALVALRDRESFQTPSGWMKLYLDDSELNRDSAMLVRSSGRTFFNMNDCKLYDRLDEVRSDSGTIDVFAAQFSGATWHPTCYQYPVERYAAISKRKAFAKFERVARAIERLEPRMYLPSAGPACFLDPDLYHLNFEDPTIFSHLEKIAWYLRRRLRRVTTQVAEIGPGGVVELGPEPRVARPGVVPSEADRPEMLQTYAASRSDLFQARAACDPQATLDRLRADFALKLHAVSSMAQRVGVPLFFRLHERPDVAIKVDFPAGTIALTDEVCTSAYYELVAPAWQVARVLDGLLSWEEFSLTFRVKVRREPDVYEPVIHAFLLMDGVELGRWCSMITAIEQNRERITVTAGGTEYSVQRYCPHQGADLSQAWVEGNCLVCPRHMWRFDLQRNGACTTNATGIDARAAECVEVRTGEIAARTDDAFQPSREISRTSRI